MTRPNLKAAIENLSYVKLLEHKNHVEKAVAERRELEKRKLKNRVTKLVSDAGLTVDEVLRTRKPRKALKVTRNPKDRKQIYRGAGPKPQWLKQMEKAG
jgi:hypothetical protein